MHACRAAHSPAARARCNIPSGCLQAQRGPAVWCGGELPDPNQTKPNQCALGAHCKVDAVRRGGLGGRGRLGGATHRSGRPGWAMALAATRHLQLRTPDCYTPARPPPPTPCPAPPPTTTTPARCADAHHVGPPDHWPAGRGRICQGVQRAVARPGGGHQGEAGRVGGLEGRRKGRHAWMHACVSDVMIGLWCLPFWVHVVHLAGSGQARLWEAVGGAAATQSKAKAKAMATMHT